MELVKVLPSEEDEVNVACFHPSVGGGLVCLTKKGKLRILHYDSSHGMNYTSSSFPNENMLEVNCADSNVGDAKVRGINGGEKQHLSLACELIASPSVIFADEPTIG